MWGLNLIELAKLLFTILCFVALCILVIGVTLFVIFYLCKRFRKSIQFKNDEEGMVIKIDDNKINKRK